MILGRESSNSGLETENTAVGDAPRWLATLLYPQNVGPNFADKRGRSVGIVRSQNRATELLGLFISYYA
jgi:hypothetical protein